MGSKGSESKPKQIALDPARVRVAAGQLGAKFSKAEEVFSASLARVADPAMALANWERLAEDESSRRDLSRIAPNELNSLVQLLGGSQFLSNLLQGKGSGWLSAFRAAAMASRRYVNDYEDSYLPHVEQDWGSFAVYLRQLRNQEYLRIGFADLEGRFDVDTTVSELTALADATCSAAVHWARRQLLEMYGELWSKPPVRGRAGVPNAFCVLGMGKLGGGELNFSSDIDLVYLYQEDGPVSVGGHRGNLDSRAYFIKLAELVTKALHEITGDGFVFRVDLRLRPDGMNGPIANSLANALLYYESYGQTWERTALIQARPIAGNRALGERFLEEVRPFVYRRYLDFATVADMKAMKARVESELGGEASRLNVKLGRGGIREIEFLVQVLQLIHGGRDESLRGRGTMHTLSRLEERGYLSAEECARLKEAYRFLRNVEHKIQIVHQRQTHSLPAEPVEQELLARRLGYLESGGVSRFWSDLERHRDRVRASFEQLFYEPSAQQQRGVDADTEELLRLLDDPEAAKAKLGSMGFASLQESLENILLLRDGPSWAPAHARRRKALFQLAPSLIAATLKSADPDLSLRNMATFVSSIGARTSFLSLLQENPATLRMLVDLFGGSQYLANWFIRHPEMLDSLVRADLVQVRRGAEELDRELSHAGRDTSDIEARLDALRRFRNQEFLRIGIGDIQGLLDPQDVSRELTLVAEACVRHAYASAEQLLCSKLHRKRLPGRGIVLAMGKLGSRELNYNSDLDLIFVYDESRKRAPSVAPAQECFARLAQMIMMTLQTTTREGIAYKIDTRLRPSGNKGPLVTSFAGFQEYHQFSAQIWERQALIKARVVAGDPMLAVKVEAVVARFVFRAPLRADEVREIHRLRQRMELELGRESADRINIKTGRGGLVDIEFLVQMLQMHFGGENAKLRVRATLDALSALVDAGILPPDDASVLQSGYKFIRRVENTLRLSCDRPVDGLDRSDLRLVAKRMGFGSDDKAFWDAWEDHRETIRACFEKWFDRIERSAR